MNVKIIALTQVEPELKALGVQSPNDLLAYCARVSNPSNQMNTETSDNLVKYCVRKKHWSIFETVHILMEIETTRDIGRQILRHRSFTFQEFSQRYADPTKSLDFITREARLQDTKNRQGSLECSDTGVSLNWEAKQIHVIRQAQEAYAWAVENGIAKEQARSVLPEGCTNTKMYMSGTLRSWIHWCELRTGSETQKEHRQIAAQAWELIEEHFPSLKGVIELNKTIEPPPPKTSWWSRLRL